MTVFEITYLTLSRFLLPLHGIVRARLREVVCSLGPLPLILDVGGRKSPYTVGVAARITISDLPRETEIDESLNLGINEAIIARTLRRRSNVEEMVYDDMTRSRFQNESFDCVSAIEVLEHVSDDLRFVEEVRRVLRPGGVFLMTTPNGEFVENTNPITNGTTALSSFAPSSNPGSTTCRSCTR